LPRAAQSTRTIARNGRNVLGIAGGLLVCSGCGMGLSVLRSSDERRSYGCRRVSSRGGRCPRPVYVSKPRADAFVEELLLDMLERTDLDVVASSRDLERARRSRDAARAELEAYIVNAAALDARLFTTGLQARQAKVAEADAAYEDLAAHAEAAESIPSASAWQALNLDDRRRIARLLIDSIVVAPPLSRSKFAPVEKRLTVRWNGTGQDASAGR
jgi:Recombinase zinc beta ribbon domain